MKMRKKIFSLFIILLTSIAILAGCSLQAPVPSPSASGSDVNYKKLTGHLTLEKNNAPVNTRVKVVVTDIAPNEKTEIIWKTVKGSYKLKNIYQFVGEDFQQSQMQLASGVSNDKGVFETEIEIPEDFGGDHDIDIYQNNELVAKANFFVETTFTIDSKSGPIGSWITIKGQGIGWTEYGSIWHANYDNKYTGMITAVSTKGTAEARFRAAGPVGLHTITIESGALGMPYINRDQSPISYVHTNRFSYTVTDDKPGNLSYVSDLPESAANGGAELPAPQNANGVSVALDKVQGIVKEDIKLSANGLPVNTEVTIKWATMKGSRVTSAGFSEVIKELGKASTDGKGNLNFPFSAPDDLGGPPHRIDVTVGDKVMGQTYFKILPSISKVTPISGPAGTEISFEIKGVGWTEYDNIYSIDYDNAFIGYSCGFNSQGTVKFKLIASGVPGYHIIDLYPGIYKGEQKSPNIFIRPQLTYQKDHPGSRIPSVHIGFELTE